MVECQLPKLDVAGSSPVTRSTIDSTSNENAANRGRLRCPTCGRVFVRSESRFAPFCCERCKLIDLGDWLDERHRIPGEDAPAGGGSEPDDDS